MHLRVIIEDTQYFVVLYALQERMISIEILLECGYIVAPSYLTRPTKNKSKFVWVSVGWCGPIKDLWCQWGSTRQSRWPKPNARLILNPLHVDKMVYITLVECGCFATVYNHHWIVNMYFILPFKDSFFFETFHVMFK